MPTTLFPDTNLFLHCKAIKEIDWPAVAGTKPVKLIVCMQVVKELDKHKRDARFGIYPLGGMTSDHKPVPLGKSKVSVPMDLDQTMMRAKTKYQRLSDFAERYNADTGIFGDASDVRQYNAERTKYLTDLEEYVQ